VCRATGELRRKKLTTINKAFTGLVLVSVLLLSTATAGAVPASKLAQARAVKSQIEKLDDKVEIAIERYNGAREKHGRLVSQKRAAAKRLKKIQKRQSVVQGHLNTRVNSMYRKGPMGFVDVLLGAETFEEFAATWDVLEDMSTSDAASVAELKKLRKEAKAVHADLTSKEKAAAKQLAIMTANKRSILGQLAERKRKLSGLESEIAALQAAEERARAARRVSYSSGGGGGDYPPPTNQARSEVVPYAKRFIGVPYRWGGSSPSGFDCSGFTSYVYRNAAGISLPRVSRAQIGAGQRVSRKDLQPGDLVFFGSPIHHVGIYVGGNSYIHAPNTGARVRIDSLNRGGYAGACRP
jgi:cell wall-associated NlpC family hydrolase